MDLSGYIGNIFSIYIVLSMVENLVSSEKYVRYIKLFGGIIMVIAVIKPVSAFFLGDNIGLDAGIFDGYELSDSVYADILNAEKGRNDEIISMYTASVLERADMYAAAGGYELVDGSVELNIDEDDEKYGAVELIRLTLKKEQQDGGSGAYVDENDAFYDYNLVTLKNNLANFYNLPQSNIYINIYNRQDYKEGLGD
ncbi:putative uncharacterized protein [Firmicutes bacterium CAG:882]|nr:putative uncharacterized protein [Firmicutes bacterium CAG:882]